MGCCHLNILESPIQRRFTLLQNSSHICRCFTEYLNHNRIGEQMERYSGERTAATVEKQTAYTI